MKRFFTLWIVAAMMMVAGSARAQFKADIIDVPRTNWCEGYLVEFSLSEVCGVIGCTTGQLTDALDAWKAAAGGDTNAYEVNELFEVVGSSAGNHSEQYGGYMMDIDGNIAYWTTGAVWGVYIYSWDLAEDKLVLCVDQNPTNPIPEGGVCHGIISIGLYGGKATFELTLRMVEQDKIDKVAETDLERLEIVGETSVSMEQEPNTQWLNFSYQIPTAGIADSLGIDQAYMEDMFKQMVFAKQWDASYEKWGGLTSEGAATPSPGFYFSGGIIPEGEDVEIQECTNAPYSDGDLFWIANLQYDATNDQVTCYVGQYPNGMKLNETRKADIYIVYGNKAYIIHYTFTVQNPPQTPITDLKKAGEETWTIELRDPRKTWSELEYHNLDMDAIVAAISKEAGVEVSASDLKFMANNKYGGITNTFTADNYEGVYGYWMSQEGIVGGYSDAYTCYYIDYIEATEEAGAQLGLGNKPNYFDGGEKATGSVFFVYNDEIYYEVKLDMGVMLPEYTFETCKQVEYNLNVKLVPSASSWEIGKTDMAAVEAILGTNAGVLYGVTPSGTLTTAYSVSEASQGGGGFWMTPQDENGTAYSDWYSGEGAFAMWYYNSKITWYTNPGHRQPGETSNATFYIMNNWDGIVVKLNVNIKFVDHIVNITTVGEEDITILGRGAEGDYYETELDLTKCCEQLICSKEELLENGKWMVINEAGELAEGNFDEIYGYGFNEDGDCVENLDDAVFTLGNTVDGFHAFIVNDEDVSKEFQTTLYMMYNNKLYGFNFTVTGSVTGIKSVKTEKSNKTFDLTGREVKSPSKGIYIVNGKKVKM